MKEISNQAITELILMTAELSAYNEYKKIYKEIEKDLIIEYAKTEEMGKLNRRKRLNAVIEAHVSKIEDRVKPLIVKDMRRQFEYMIEADKKKAELDALN